MAAKQTNKKRCPVDRRLGMVMKAETRCLVIGEILVMRTSPGKMYLANMIGEGMECEEKKLAAVIEKFFAKNF